MMILKTYLLILTNSRRILYFLVNAQILYELLLAVRPPYSHTILPPCKGVSVFVLK